MVSSWWRHDYILNYCEINTLMAEGFSETGSDDDDDDDDDDDELFLWYGWPTKNI